MHGRLSRLRYFIFLHTFFQCYQLFEIQCQNLPVNSICTQKNGKLGVCTILENCKSIREGLEARKLSHSTIKNCGFLRDDVIVCCPDTIPPTTINPIAKSTLSPKVILFPEDRVEKVTVKTPTRFNQRRADLACDRWKALNFSPLSFHVINGEDALPGEFPHMAALGYELQTFSNASADWKCGGTLISENFILTAAHCVPDPQNPPILIRMGKVSLNSDEDGLAPIDAGISEIIPHPQYKYPLYYNDIALIRLNISVEFSSEVKPACLYSDPADTPTTAILSISGWGESTHDIRSKSDKLLKGSIKIESFETCNATHSEYRERKLPQSLRIDQICATDPIMKQDTCQGDSGGPLQIFNLHNQPATVIGITSFGFDCLSGIPGVYTKVYSFLDWIENIVWSE